MHQIYKLIYLERGVPGLGDLPSCVGGVMWGNFAGDGSNEGVSTEKIFCSITFISPSFLGVILFINSKSRDKGCPNNDEISFEGGRTIELVDAFESLFGTSDGLSEVLVGSEVSCNNEQ